MDRKIRIILISIVILIFLVAIVGGILYFSTDLLKSDEVLFKKYLAQDIEYLSDITDFREEEQYLDYLRKNDYTENSEISLSFIENENDQEEVYSIKTESINKNNDKSYYKNVKINYGSQELSNIDFLRQNEIYGFRLSDLVQQFVSIENATMYYVVTNLGYNGNYFQEKMDIDKFDFTGLLDFSDEEIQQLKNKYYNVVFSNINSKCYSSKNNVIITLNNGESITTKQFSLTLSKTDMDIIYKKILNEVVNDQIILSKLENIDKEITEIGLIEPEGKSFKDRFILKIKEIHDSIEYLGQTEEKIIFNVYQSKGTTYRTTMKTDRIERIIDLNNQNGIELSYKLVKLEQEGEKVFTYSLGKQLDGFKSISYKDDNRTLSVNFKEEDLDDTFNIIGNVLYHSENTNKFEIKLKEAIDFSNKKQLEISFNNNNNIILNDFENEDIDNIFDNFRSRIIKSLEEKKSIVNTKMINNILLWVDKIESDRINQENNALEFEKHRFNNKFVLYEGNNIKYSTLKKLLVLAGKNSTDIEVIDGKNMKILIQPGAKNEETMNRLIDVLKSKEDTYNIKMDYGEDGYINSINISVYTKKY